MRNYNPFVITKPKLTLMASLIGVNCYRMVICTMLILRHLVYSVLRALIMEQSDIGQIVDRAQVRV